MKKANNNMTKTHNENGIAIIMIVFKQVSKALLKA